MDKDKNISELQSPFEQLREVDANGKEWWNSRKLARVMGYGKYWRQFLEVAFIDMVELRAIDHVVMTMADWKDVLSRYMELNNKALLTDTGRVTHEQAEEKALTEYEKFRVIQDREILSDFDRQLKSLFDSNKSGI